MALINCPECGKEVSDKASACIHCGYPLENISNEKSNEYYDKLLEELEGAGEIQCPKCGSTQIQAVPRKWSLLTGLLTNQVDRVCLNCKNKF